jgi:predicted ATPase
LRNWALAGSHKRPLIIAIEDLHWIDRSSEEYLATLVDSLAGAPILLVCTWRPGYRPAWSEHSYVTQLALRPLNPTDSLTVVESILTPEAITAPLVVSILKRAEGNPFFLEELARAQTDHRDSNPEALPETVQGVLAGRLDRLPEAPRRALQSASVIGRIFSLRLLRAIWDRTTPLETSLQELERLEFVHDHDIGGEPGFIFKHALTQESAYASLSTKRRRQLHEQIGQALLEQVSDIADTQPELLAHHFTEAGFDDVAIGYWRQAGDRAAERSANVEAVSHFRQALDLTRNLPESTERARRELALQIVLGNALIATKGYGARETVETYTRARALAEQLNEPTLLFPLLYRKWVTHTIWSQQRDARAVAQEFLSLAEQQVDPAPRMMGHRLLGLTLFLMGELAASRTECDRALELYDAERHSALALRYGQEPRAAIMVWTSMGLWLTGDSVRADRTMAEALASARESGHINTLAYVVVYGCCLLESIRGNASAIEPYLRSAFDLASEHDLAMWRAYAIAFEGWMTATRGDLDQGIVGMREGLSQMRAIGAVIFRPHLLGLLAWTYAEAGQIELALETLAEAIGQVETSAERWCESELYRLRGDILGRQQGKQDMGVQSCFREALSVAHAQGAIWLEQRVRASLH